MFEDSAEVLEGNGDDTSAHDAPEVFRPDQTFRRPATLMPMPSLLPAVSGINPKDLEGWQLPKLARPTLRPETSTDSIEDIETLASQDLDKPTWNALKVGSFITHCWQI
jgi:hypothetical protein